LFLFAAAAIFFSVREQIRISNLPTINPSEYPDYTALSDMKRLTLVKNFESWTPNSEIPNEFVKELKIARAGNISRGYVYIRASVDDVALTRWESVYVKFDDLGGHLFRAKSLPVPNGDKTELLYALDDVPYLSSVPYSESRAPEHADWFSLVRSNSSFFVFSFISSLRPATIEEITIYYACAGAAECSLTIE
jgi:hypothetical protein